MGNSTGETVCVLKPLIGQYRFMVGQYSTHLLALIDGQLVGGIGYSRHKA
jgi:hypothetical protein